MSVIALIKRFMPYLRSVRAHVLLSIACIIVSPLAGTLLLSLVESLVDNVFVAGKMDMLVVFLGGYLALVGIKFVVDRLQERAELAASRRIVADLKANLYKHMMSLSPGSLPDLGVGQILSRMSGDTGKAEYLVFSGIVGAAENIIKIATYTIFLYTLSSTLTLCAILMVPVLGLTSMRGSSKLRYAYDTIGRQVGSMTSLAEERLSARPIIQAFDAEAREAAIFGRKCLSSVDAELKAWKIQAGLSGVFEAITAFSAILLIAIGAHEIHEHKITVGALVAYLGSLGSLYDPAKSLAKTWGKFERAATSAERLATLLDTKSQVTDPLSPVTLPSVRGTLEFHDVRFGYTREREILRGVSLRIEAGENVAIVGASGTGKSTLLRLALRFYDPISGSITLDGVDIKKLALATLRRSMATVLQEPHIFRASVSDNIRYGNPDAPDARLYSMARAAQAHDFIEKLPEGYAANTGPRGGAFSGGQRQRLSMARALMRDAPILLLDEATASLDGETEEAIQNALRQFKGWRTIITIAHRLASIRDADRVIVMERGRIVEVGSPNQLLNADSRCRSLFSSQIAALKISA